MTDRTALDRLQAWDPRDELPDDLARALDADDALRAAFDARFPPTPLADAPPASEPAFLPERVVPPHRARLLPILAVALPIAAAFAIAVTAVFGSTTPIPGQPLPSDARGGDGARARVVEIELPGRSVARRPAHHGRVVTAEVPSSAIRVDVGTASWVRVGSALRAGVRPPAASVDVDELVGAFAYTDPAPVDDALAVTTEAVRTPWDPATHLVRIGVQARRGAPVAGRPLARDVALEIAWDPAVVRWYREVGDDGAQVDGAPVQPVVTATIDVGAHVTALYEVSLAPGASNPLGELRARYVPVDGTEVRRSWPVRVEPGTTWVDASRDTRLAVSVAAFGEKLRGRLDEGALPWKRLDDLVASATRPEMPQEAELRALVGLAGRLERR